MAGSRLADRISWFLTRTPYRHARKAALRAVSHRALAERRAPFAGIALEPTEDRIVAGLREDGFAPVSELLDPALLQAMYDKAAGKLGQPEPAGSAAANPNKDYWARLLDEDLDEAGRQPSESPFVRLAIDEAVLRVVSAYFSDAPYLDYVYLLHSKHSPGPLRVSQLWHRDYDDTRLLKLMVYLTDCEAPEDGPFTILPVGHSRKVGFALHSHRTDAELGPGRSEHAKPFYGKKLTAFMVDTGRCYHMGSRVAEGHERLLYMAAYVTLPKYNRRPAMTYRLTGQETPMQQSALTFS